MKELDNLRDAFPAMPEECRSALSTAARSVKEEEPVKRFVLRTALIWVLITVMLFTNSDGAKQFREKLKMKFENNIKDIIIRLINIGFSEYTKEV